MKHKETWFKLIILTSVLATQACQEKKVDRVAILAIAKASYVYGLPLVLTDLTRIGSGKSSNQFTHNHAFPDHTFKLVVRPNNDTYYSSAFLDLGAEPVVLNIPDTKDRYAVVPLMDAWTNVFASFGKRNTGTKAQRYVITGPKWKGSLPDSVIQVQSPTELVWIIGRIQVNSLEDGKKIVTPIQEGLKLTPLSQWENTTSSRLAGEPVEYSIESSEPIQLLRNKKISVVEALKRLSLEEYLTYLNELLVKNPGLEADSSLLKKAATIGVKSGVPFRMENFDEALRKELQSVPGLVLSALDSARTILTSSQEGKPDLSIGHYGNNYKKRAAVAYFGLGALGPEDAIYQGYRVDEDNKPLSGESDYVIHFEKGNLPPARAFWSITLYNKEGYLTENSIRRYAIGDRNNLKYNKDGSLNIYIQHKNPGADKEANWLPAPKDGFNLSVRIYWPTGEFLQNGNWTKPPIKKVIGD